MAEAKARRHNVRLEQKQEEINCLASDSMAAEKTTKFSHVHEYLDFYQLFNVFISEFREKLLCDSIEYENNHVQSSLLNGSRGRHQCEYMLKHEKLSLGMIRITRGSEFSNQEMAVIEAMLAGLVLPLRNVLHQQQAFQLAQGDKLTTPENGSYYQDAFDLEIMRPNRNKNPCSLIMLNLDEINSINTNYGHQAGEALLHEVADRISSKSRSNDVVCRVGGNIFLIFLANTGKAEASIVAERIKGFVLSRRFEYKNKVVSFSLNVDIVSIVQEDAIDKLIDGLDEPLFHAKIPAKEGINVDSFASGSVTEQI